MKKYFIKRFASTIPVLIGVTVLCFILMTMSGKDPAVAAAIRSNSAGDTILVDSLREEMGLEKPLPTRYFLWLKGLLNGDMGKSVVTYHRRYKNFFSCNFQTCYHGNGMDDHYCFFHSNFVCKVSWQNV